MGAWMMSIEYESDEQRNFYEGFKSLDDPNAPPGTIRIGQLCWQEDQFERLETKTSPGHPGDPGIF